MISIKNLTKTYSINNESFNALDNISIDINSNEIFGIVGLSGAGKSTLIRCINRLEEPTSGEISIDSLLITSLSKKNLLKRRQKIGMIFQNFNLFNSRTVFQNVAYPLEILKLSKYEIEKKVLLLLNTVGLIDKKNAYPSTLSGGQKQRVAIARALANDPDILLCDEATSALDPQTTKSILSLIREIKDERNLTVVLITHQMEVVREICDRVAILEAGKVIELDSVTNIFTNPKTATTKDFIRHLRPETIYETNFNKKDNLYRLHFIGANAGSPIISTLLKNHDIEVNILSGNINTLYHGQVGNLVISISGKPPEIDKALKTLSKLNVKWEVI